MADEIHALKELLGDIHPGEWEVRSGRQSGEPIICVVSSGVVVVPSTVARKLR